MDELLGEAMAQCPSVARDRIWMPQASEVTLTFERFGDIVERRVTSFIFVVPFEGEAAVFTFRPSTYRPSGQRAVGLEEQAFHLAVDNPVGGGGGVLLRFGEQLAGVEEHLGWSRQQVEQHNQQMRAQVPGMVSRRRAELLATRNVQAEIGFPIRRRPDADSVPIKRPTRVG